MMEFDGINYIWLGEDKMIKKYKTGGWKKLIETVECFKETDKNVWLGINPRTQKLFNQYRKRSMDINFFDTWEKAYQYIYRKAIEDAANKVKASDNAKNYLEKIRDMKFNKESE